MPCPTTHPAPALFAGVLWVVEHAAAEPAAIYASTIHLGNTVFGLVSSLSACLCA